MKSLCLLLCKEYDYMAACRLLEEGMQSGNSLFGFNQAEAAKVLSLVRGFAAWDQFEYQRASDYIYPFKCEEAFGQYYETLQTLQLTLEWFEGANKGEPSPAPGFILVYDVLHNADRRAAQGQHDDAAVRVYRALEMYAQFCLLMQIPPLSTRDLAVDKLPAKYRAYCHHRRDTLTGKVQIGLKDSFDLLAELNHPVGGVWRKWRENLINLLYQQRNSLLVHGVKPLNHADYLAIRQAAWHFISDVDSAMQVTDGLTQYRQLPQQL